MEQSLWGTGIKDMEAETYFLLFYAGTVSIVPIDLIPKKSFWLPQPTAVTPAGFFSGHVQSLLTSHPSPLLFLETGSSEGPGSPFLS